MDAAMDIAAASVDGRLRPADIEDQVITRCREIVGTVHGPDDPAWALQIDVCRQVLHANGLTADEVAEWLAVLRGREGVVEQPAVSWIEQALADGCDGHCATDECVCPAGDDDA